MQFPFVEKIGRYIPRYVSLTCLLLSAASGTNMWLVGCQRDVPEHIRYLFIVSYQATKKSTNRIKKHDRRLNGSNCLYGDEDTLGDLWWTSHQSIHAKFISYQPQHLVLLPWPTCPLSSHSSPPKDIRQRDEVTSSQFRVRLFLPPPPFLSR